MKLPAPPFDDVTVDFDDEDAALKLDESEQRGFLALWPEAWPTYRKVLEELFSSYDYKNLFETQKTRVVIEKLAPNKKANEGANLLLRFSFDDSGITWDIFQKAQAIVHAQPAF